MTCLVTSVAALFDLLPNAQSSDLEHSIQEDLLCGPEVNCLLQSVCSQSVGWQPDSGCYFGSLVFFASWGVT